MSHSPTPTWVHLDRIASLERQLQQDSPKPTVAPTPQPELVTLTSDFKAHQPIDRVKLYEEVWSTPFTTLAPQYGYSDAGLRKVCLALDIPIPGVGYWAKVAAGYVAERPRLPEQTSRVTRYRKDPRLLQANTDATRAEDKAWLSKMEEAERVISAGSITDIDVPKAVVQIEAGIERALKKAPKALDELRAKDAKRKKPSKHQPWEFSYETFEWSSAASNANVLNEHDEHAPRVSLSGAAAAVKILKKFCFGAIRRGAHIAAAAKGASVQVEMAGEKFSVTIKERLIDEKLRRDLTGVEYTTRIGTGQFTLIVDGIGVSQKEFPGDEKELGVAIEQGELFLALYRRVMYCRHNTRMQAARQEVWDRDRREAERAREIARAAQEARKNEEKRRGEFADEAALWGRVQQLRSYIQAVKIAAGNTPTSEVKEWFAWAERVVEEADPIAKRLKAQSPQASGEYE